MKNEERLSEKFLQSHIYTKYGNFFISTIYRRSSAALAPDNWYYETFAWKLNDKNEQTDLIADNSGAYFPEKAIEQHIEVCKQLNKSGIFDERSEE